VREAFFRNAVAPTRSRVAKSFHRQPAAFGSTLTEQILAFASQVEGTAEIADLPAGHRGRIGPMQTAVSTMGGRAHSRAMVVRSGSVIWRARALAKARHDLPTRSR